MNRRVDVRRPQRRRRSRDGLAPAVSLLRWRSDPSTDGVFEMFSAHESGRFRSIEPASLESADGENVLLVSATRKVAPDTPAVLLSLVNTSLSQAVKLSLKLAGRTPTSLTGTILTAPPMTPRPERARKGSPLSSAVRPRAFRGAVLKGKVVEVTVPARSVVVLTVDQRSAVAGKSEPSRRSRGM